MRRSWLIAATVHAAALFALSRVPIRVVVPPPAPDLEVPIDMTAELEGSTAAPEPAPATAPGAAAPAPPRVASVTQAPSERSVPDRSDRSRTETGDGPQAPSGPTGDGVVTLPGQPTNLGLGAAGRNPFLPTSEAAVTLAETKRSVDRAMKDLARERVTSLGLGPE